MYLRAEGERHTHTFDVMYVHICGRSMLFLVRALVLVIWSDVSASFTSREGRTF